MNPLMTNIFSNLIKPLTTKYSTGRPPVTCHVLILKSIIYKIESCCNWRNVPIYGDYSYGTVYNYFQLWIQNKIFSKLYKHILKIYSTNIHISWKYLSVDSSMIRALRGGECIGRNHFDRNRNAVKLNVIVDNNGIPLSYNTSPANEHDINHVNTLLNNFIIKRPIYEQYFLADRGYDSMNLRETLRSKRFVPVIPYRNMRGRQGIELTENELVIYQKRKVIENYFAKLKSFKAIRTRYERLISHFNGFIDIANSIIVSKML